MFAISIYSLGITRKPAFLHTLALLEKLYNRPQARKAEYTHKGRQQRVGYKERACNTTHTRQKKKPPTLHAPIILCLDDEGMEQAYAQKGRHSDENTCEMHRANSIETPCGGFPHSPTSPIRRSPPSSLARCPERQSASPVHYMGRAQYGRMPP